VTFRAGSSRWSRTSIATSSSARCSAVSTSPSPRRCRAAPSKRPRKKLSLWKQGRPAVANEYELELLNDSAVFDYAINGVTAVGRYAARKDVKLSDDETRVLRAMTDAYPTVVVVRETTPELGAKVYDVLRDEELFLTDLALASHGAADASLAVRLMRADGIVMTAGPIRALDDNVGRLLAAVGKLPANAWSPRSRGALGTNL